MIKEIQAIQVPKVSKVSKVFKVFKAYKERKVNEALGDSARFTALAREYQHNPGVTRSRLYLETMEEILPRLKKTIVDDRGDLDLTIVRRKPEDNGALESIDSQR